jgi:calmodulin
MKSLGLYPNQEQLRSLMREIDLDNNGSVDFNEFVIWMSIKMSPETSSDRERELEDTFKIFDENGDHFITAQELQGVMNRLGQSLSEEEIKMMIQSADIDNDRRINFKGFNSLAFSLSLSLENLFKIYFSIEFVQLMRQFDA